MMKTKVAMLQSLTDECCDAVYGASFVQKLRDDVDNKIHVLHEDPRCLEHGTPQPPTPFNK